MVNDEVVEIWKGKLNNNSYAVLLVNRASIEYNVEVNLTEIGFNNKNVKLRDLWNKTDLGEFKEKYSVLIKSHDCVFLKVSIVEDDDKMFYIVLITAASAVLISIMLVLIFYCRMKHKKLDEINENDRLMERSTKIEE